MMELSARGMRGLFYVIQRDEDKYSTPLHSPKSGFAYRDITSAI